MLKVYTEIFDKDRLRVWKKLKFMPGYLAGGTGLSLQLKHRRSYDFDLFLDKAVSNKLIFKVKKILEDESVKVVVDSGDELTLFIGKKIKLSFVYFPFRNLYDLLPTESVWVADVRDLVANKAYAIGRRGVWRDYVDIYWCLKNNIVSFDKLVFDSEKKFNGLFNKKLFLEQLVYFEGLENRAVEWLGEEVKNEEIEVFFEKLVEKKIKGI